MRAVTAALVMMTAMALSAAVAAAPKGNLDEANANVYDRASLERGASYFSQFCMGCHSLQYMRYQRLADDLDLSETQLMAWLLPPDREPGDYMMSSMPYDASADWFGKGPPDLSLTSRSRGPNWIYTFLRSYYLTDGGWQNLVLENPAMPHVLWELQGIQRPIMEGDGNGQGAARVVGFELDQPGLMSASEYDQFARDLTAFLTYVGEPAILKRERIGIWVMLFLSLLTLLSYFMYQEYWRDIKK